MIEKLKKIGIVLTIAVLFTIFIFAMTNAIYPSPEYNDYCDESKGDVLKPIDEDVCQGPLPTPNCRGPINYEYDANGCPISAECDSCYEFYEVEQEKHNLVLFLVSSIVGLIAILYGIFSKGADKFWILVKGGFLLGGLISLFIGTGVYYQDMARFLKPAVILIELILVILVTRYLMKKGK